MVEDTIPDIAAPHVDRPGCYYALSRLLPDQLAQRHSGFLR